MEWPEKALDELIIQEPAKRTRWIKSSKCWQLWKGLPKAKSMATAQKEAVTE